MLLFIRFKPSRTKSSTVNLVSSLMITLLFVLVAYGLFPWALLFMLEKLQMSAGRFEVPYWLGLPWIVIGGLLGSWAVVIMALDGRGTPWYGVCARRLVMTGPYRHLRYPQVLGSLLCGVGVGIEVGSPWLIVYPIVGFLLWYGIMRPIEEAELEVRFRIDYRRYLQNVPGWLPRVKPYRPEHEVVSES